MGAGLGFGFPSPKPYLLVENLGTRRVLGSTSGLGGGGGKNALGDGPHAGHHLPWSFRDPVFQGEKSVSLLEEGETNRVLYGSPGALRSTVIIMGW